MIISPNEKYQPLIEKVFEYKQEHIFRFWDDLTIDEKIVLLKQISTIDFELMSRLIKDVKSDSISKSHADKLEPADIISLQKRANGEIEELKIGEELIIQGKVAAFLVSGGQGTRLGYNGPKGMFPVTPVKKKSLFQLHAEKLIAIGRKYKKQIPWFIMTSETNHDETVKFFKKNNYFGYNESNISFFTQAMIPAINMDGKFILDSKNHIFTNPNGHGGSLSALWNSSSIEKLQTKGIEYLFYFQVDNVLTQICDPTYLGYHVKYKSEMSNKVVRKAYPEEKMGVICKVNGKTGLVEYSDLPENEMKAINSDGTLKYWAGNIATHIFDLSFIVKENQGGFKLPYHLARKAIPFVDNSGNTIKPQNINGIKFESFVFDALLDTEKSISIEVERDQEFSPLKNKEGLDSPVTVKRDLNNLYGHWLEDSGIQIPKDAEGHVDVDIEISPLYALNKMDIKNKNISINKVSQELYLD